MTTSTYISMASRATFCGDWGTIVAARYPDRRSVIDALTAGNFPSDCANFVKLLLYLIEMRDEPFVPAYGLQVPESPLLEEVRYISAADIYASNCLPFPSKGQWIVRLEGRWLGLTPAGFVSLLTPEEWVPVARAALRKEVVEAEGDGNFAARHESAKQFIDTAKALLEGPWRIRSRGDFFPGKS